MSNWRKNIQQIKFEVNNPLSVEFLTDGEEGVYEEYDPPSKYIEFKVLVLTEYVTEMSSYPKDSEGIIRVTNKNCKRQLAQLPTLIGAKIKLTRKGQGFSTTYVVEIIQKPPKKTKSNGLL